MTEKSHVMVIGGENQDLARVLRAVAIGFALGLAGMSLLVLCLR